MYIMTEAKRRERALKLAEKLIDLTEPNEGMHLHALQIRNRLLLPMSEILSKVPGRTVSEKAKAAGVTRQCFYWWMNGVTRPNGRRAKVLAKLTGYSPEEIRGTNALPARLALPATPALRTSRG